MTTQRASAVFGLAALVVALVLGACEPGVVFKPPKLQRLLIQPESVTLTLGQTLEFQARGIFSDGNTRDLPATYTATGGSVTANGTYTATVVGNFQVVASLTTGENATANVRILEPALLRVRLVPDSARAETGQTVQFDAIGEFSDGSSRDTITVQYQAAGGTITSDGLYTAGPAEGRFPVIALAANNPADTSYVVVVRPPPPPPSLARVRISPTEVTLKRRGQTQFQVTGVLTDSSVVPVSVTFTATGGTISPAGLYVAGDTIGTFRVTAQETAGLRDSATVVIELDSLASISIAPSVAIVPPRGSQQFTVTGRYPDGSSADVTKYTSLSATGGTIDGSGLFSADSASGQFAVSGAIQHLTSTATLYIAPPDSVLFVALSPESKTLLSGDTTRFQFSGTFGDGSTRPVSGTYAATGGAIDTAGLYTAGPTAGTYHVIATHSNGRADTSAVTIGRTLLSVTLAPATANLSSGDTVRFAPTGQYNDGTSEAVPASYTATGGAIDDQGLYTAGPNAGAFQVIAAHTSGKADTATVMINRELVSVSLAPAAVSLASGDTVRFVASGSHNDGTAETVIVTYSATGGTINESGLYSAGNTAGAFSVIATHESGKADTASVTIDLTLQSISVTPVTTSLASGDTARFTTVANYNDGTTLNVAASYTAKRGTFDGALYTAGAVAGTDTIVAAFLGKTDSSFVTVTRTLMAVSLTPAMASLPSGDTVRFSTAGSYNDATNENVAATYTAKRGTIDASGLYTAGAVAATDTIVASFQGKADSSFVTITRTLMSVSLTPPTANLPSGDTVRFTTTASYNDATNESVAATYTARRGSFNGNLYTAGAMAGTDTVVATFQGKADSSLVTITRTLMSVSLAPASASLPSGDTLRFAVLGTFNDGTNDPVPVTFSATGGTIDNAGLYTAGAVPDNYTVIATHASGLADTSTVTITKALLRITMTPATALVESDSSFQFSTVGNYSVGGTDTVTVSYSATGGTITSGGSYTAGPVAGIYQVVATHASGKAATSTVTIPPRLLSISLAPTTATVPAGGQIQFTTTAEYSDAGLDTVTVAYMATGGTIGVTSGLYTAGSTPGTFQVTATHGSGLVDTATVTVAGVTMVSLTLNPDTASVPVGGTRQFSAVGNFSDGSSAVVPVTYGTTAPAGDTIFSTGVFRAGFNGYMTKVFATHANGMTDTSSVTVLLPDSISMTPDTVILARGASQQFTVVGYFGNVTGLVPTSYTATGGTINTQGFYTAGGETGSYRVIVITFPTFAADTSTVTIAAGAPLVSLTVTPAVTTVTAGKSALFTATSVYEDGSTSVGAVSWTVIGNGTIVPNTGAYTAPLTAGTDTIIATETSGKADTAVVTITAPPPSDEPVFSAGVNTTLWQDNFDGYDVEADLWSTYVTNTPGFIHLDNTGLTGTQALRFDWAQTTNCIDNERLIERSFTPTTEVYLQYWVRYEAGFAFGNPLCGADFKKFFFFWGRNNERFFLGQTFSQMRAGFADPYLLQNNGDEVTLGALADGSWHRITFHIRLGSPQGANNGMIRGWIDGDLKWNYVNVSTGPIDEFNLFKVPTTFNLGSPKAQSEWMDGFHIWR